MTGDLKEEHPRNVWYTQNRLQVSESTSFYSDLALLVIWLFCRIVWKVENHTEGRTVLEKSFTERKLHAIDMILFFLTDDKYNECIFGKLARPGLATDLEFPLMDMLL